jgi:hypothetical protein
MSRLEHAIAAAALLVACANCTSADAGVWQKAGTSEQTMSQDTAECRASAQEEALRRYPYRAGSPSLGVTGAVLSQQRDDHGRVVAEASLFNNCMQGRGYQRAPASR